MAHPCSLHDAPQPGCGGDLRPVSKGMSEKHTLYIHNGSLAFKREEILTYAATWMNPGDILLSKISQSKQDKY